MFVCAIVESNYLINCKIKLLYDHRLFDILHLNLNLNCRFQIFAVGSDRETGTTDPDLSLSHANECARDFTNCAGLTFNKRLLPPITFLYVRRLPPMTFLYVRSLLPTTFFRGRD